VLKKFLNPKNLVLRLFRLSNHLPPPIQTRIQWRLFCTPFVHRRSRQQLEFLSRGKPFSIPSGKHYRLQGWAFGQKGPTAICCHGWQGSAASWFVLAPKLLEAGFRVLVYNAPGHHSRPIRSSLPDFSQALTDMVETFGADVLVGHSFGAMTVARVARSLPDLRGAVLISSPDTLEALARGICQTLMMDHDAEARFLQHLSELSGSRLQEESVCSYAREVSCPMLLLHDEDDDVIPISTSKAISASANSALHVSQGFGHRHIIRDSALSEKTVEFLKQCVSPPIASAERSQS